MTQTHGSILHLVAHSTVYFVNNLRLLILWLQLCVLVVLHSVNKQEEMEKERRRKEEEERRLREEEQMKKQYVLHIFHDRQFYRSLHRYSVMHTTLFHHGSKRILPVCVC